MRAATSPDVVVVGGGITGASTAYELARAGLRTTLVERAELAAMASGWTLGGVRQSGRDAAELPLIRRAVNRWQTLAEELEADLEYRQGGNLRLARTPEEVEILRTMVADQKARGLALTLLDDNQAVREIAPCLSPQVLAAAYCPGDGHAHPQKTVQAYATAARRHGAQILTGTRVMAVQVQGGRISGVLIDGGEIPTARVVLATGIHTPGLLAPLGLRLPLTIQHVSVLQSTPQPPLLTQVLGAANADLAGRQQVDGRLRFTSGLTPWQQPNGALEEEQLRPPLGLLSAVIQRVCQVLPGFATARLARVWGGLIDLSPDHLPVIDALEEPAGLVVAAGFSGHGFGLGPVTGERLKDLVLGETPGDLAPFRLHRLVGQRTDDTAKLYG